MLAQHVPPCRPGLAIVTRSERWKRVLERDTHQPRLAGGWIHQSIDEAPFAVRTRRKIEAARDSDQSERRSGQIERTVATASPSGEKAINAGTIIDRAPTYLGRAKGFQPGLHEGRRSHS